jgi:hypothetical protein
VSVPPDEDWDDWDPNGDLLYAGPPHPVIYYETRAPNEGSWCLTCHKLACEDCRRAHAASYNTGICSACSEAAWKATPQD